MISEEVLRLAQILWDYQNIRSELKKSDLIWVLCSNDIKVALYATQIFLQDYASKIMFSGGIAHTNDLLATSWKGSEAGRFKTIAIELGIDESSIILEDKSTNTGENVTFSYNKLLKLGISPKRMIVVQKPFMLRRVLATYLKQWPDSNKPEIILTSPPVSFRDYPTRELDMEALINTLVGDTFRIKDYAEKGFQVPQDIPENVWSAYEKLVGLGFTRHLPMD